MPATKPTTRKRKSKVASEDELDSDNLDASDTEKPPRKRKPTPKRRSKKPRKENSDDSEFELAEGQEIVGIIAQAPEGQAPPGQLSPATLAFLSKLKDPACNDRDWFKLHEALYRAAEREWKAFVDAFTNVLSTVDRQIPHLPPSDLIHRIYRDVRFSNDKTPYKPWLSATFSRTGRKTTFACYHVYVLVLCQVDGSFTFGQNELSGGESMIAAGCWQPAKNDLASIRANIKRNPRRLRDVIENPEFTALFGRAERPKDGGRQNIFGQEDELKTAPKGVDKDHPEVDLLRCKSFVVSHKFTDEEVCGAEFQTKLRDIARVMLPFVHCLNDLMAVAEDEE